jgi:16S rRNA (uracil1498-N3)-methyltransferase
MERGAATWLLDEGAALREPERPDTDEVWLIVGPEGGVSDHEVEALTAAGATSIRLGPTVFRTSTAGAVAAAVVSTLTGRWMSMRARMT